MILLKSIEVLGLSIKGITTSMLRFSCSLLVCDFQKVCCLNKKRENLQRTLENHKLITVEKLVVKSEEREREGGREKRREGATNGTVTGEGARG